MTRHPKILQVCAVGTTARQLLTPLLQRLAAEGWTVHLSCAPDAHARALASEGWRCWPVPVARRALSAAHPVALWRLWRLMRRERYDVVHVHTPVAAVLGRLAARMAGTPHVVYTAHGFYFHDRMAAWARRLWIWLERALGRCCTDWLLCQSNEDARTAVRERILPDDRVVWIGNGVEVAAFAAARPDPALRAALGLGPEHRVVGFIGRLVREKGVFELLRALHRVRQVLPGARLLVVGEALSSDRARGAGGALARLVAALDLAGAIVFTGFRDDVPQLLALMDVFALPSHREGVPRSVIEAMAAGRPVVATDIRGCRELVVDGETGLLVPVDAPEALADALLGLLQDPPRARALGEAGRRRAAERLDEGLVLDRELAVLNRLRPPG